MRIKKIIMIFFIEDIRMSQYSIFWYEDERSERY